MPVSINSKKKTSLGENTNSGTTPSEKEKIYLGEYHGRRTYDGQRDGYAWCLLPNSDIYVGNYYRGMRHGKGLYVFKNGTRYNGYWKKNLKHGTGKMVYPDGTFYEGEWKHNSRHGYGEYSYLNGDSYKGYWKNGKHHGLGTYIFLHLNVTLKCLWYDGVQNGPGKIMYPHFTYYGTWMDSVSMGHGMYIFYNKCMQGGTHLELPKVPELSESPAEEMSQSQYDEPEDGPMSGTLGEETMESVKTASEFEDEQKIILTTEWIPLKILRFDVNSLPPEPTYDNQSIMFSEDSSREEGDSVLDDKKSLSHENDILSEDKVQSAGRINSKLSIHEEGEEISSQSNGVESK